MKQSAAQPFRAKANPVDKDGLCILSLDGGGVRGLSSLHILKRIMSEINRLREEKHLPHRLPCEVFDIIGGTSTGGLIAIMLGRLGMSIDECIAVYEELMESIFGVKAHRYKVSVKGKVQSQYDSSKVKLAIERVLRQRRLSEDSVFNDGSEHRCRVFVCCVSKDTRNSVRIRSYNQNYHDNIPATICQAALATSAATTYFDPVTIGLRQYVDGALRNNNPVTEVESEAQKLWCPDQVELKSLVKCFLTIGTGTPATEALPDRVDKFLKDLAHMNTDTEQINQNFLDRWQGHMNKKRLFRFNVTQRLHQVDLAAYKDKAFIVQTTGDYLDDVEQRTKLQACAENLMGKELQGTPLDFHETVSAYTLRVLQGSYDIQEVRDCRAVLRVTDVEKDRNDLRDTKGKRVPGTFEWITSNTSYQAWQGSGPDTLWITAGPGRGKTMLSLFILEDLEQYSSSSTAFLGSDDQKGHGENADLYYFFCSSQSGSRRSAVNILRSLIHQIVSKHEDLMKYVLDYLENDRPTDGHNQADDENEKPPRDHGKKENRSRSVYDQSPAPQKLPTQTGRAKNFLRSQLPGKAGRKNDGEMGKEEPLAKEQLEKQQREQAEGRPDDLPGDPEKDSPKSRQLELLDVSELSFILRKLIRELDVDRAYFLLDGVDECGKEEQEVLTSTLLKLWDVRPGHFKLLVVSRPLGGMGITSTIHLEQTKETTGDVEKFVSKSVEQLAHVDGFDEEVKHEVEETLLKGAEGTFLWVSLVMCEIEKKKTCTEILAAIKSVPRGLNNKYSHMLQQIDEEHQEKVYRILRWVTAAIRPLTLQELSEVVDPPLSHKVSAEQAVRDEVALTEGLLAVRGDATIRVEFVHTSAKEFLLSEETVDDEGLKKFHVGLEELNYEIAQFCYEDILRSRLSRSRIKVSELSGKDEPKMLGYAIKYWMEHVKASNWAEKNFDPNAEFFRRSSELRKNWWIAHLENSQKDAPEHYSVGSLLHLAAYFGIIPWIKPAFDGKAWIAKKGAFLKDYDHYHRTPLHVAVEQGRGAVVSLLLDQGMDIERREASLFSTPLHLAARNGHKDICEILVKRKARINARNSFESTPLTEAARGGHLEIVKLLVAWEADVNGSIDKTTKSFQRHVQNVPGFTKRSLGYIDALAYEQRSTPLIEAARRNHAEIIKHLVRNNANIEAKSLAGHNALRIAAYHGQMKSVDILIDLGANIEARDPSSQTALFMASWQDHADIVQWLLDHDAGVDVATTWGFTPLLVAARNGRVKPLNILLDAQANVEYPDEDGDTALMVAAKFGKVAAVELLIDRSANVNAHNHHGDAPLTCAIPWKGNLTDEYLEIVQMLVKHGANVDRQCKCGLTALMIATRLSNGNVAGVVRHLLQKGAALDTKDKEGRTTLMHAFKGGLRETQELLLDHGAALEAKDNLGDTVLIMAAGYSDASAVEFLLERGANIDVHNRYGFTPLMKAARCGLEDTVKLLLDRGMDIAAVDNEDKAAIDHAARWDRGNMIKLLKSRDTVRRKLKIVSRGAATLSKIMDMYWPVEDCRKWEGDWEKAELEKTSGKKTTADAAIEDQKAPKVPGIRDSGITDASSENTEVAVVDEDSADGSAGEHEDSDIQGGKDGDTAAVELEEKIRKLSELSVDSVAEKETEQEVSSIEVSDEGHKTEMEDSNELETKGETRDKGGQEAKDELDVKGEQEVKGQMAD